MREWALSKISKDYRWKDRRSEIAAIAFWVKIGVLVGQNYMRKKYNLPEPAEDEDLVTGAVATGLRPVGQSGNGAPNGDGPQDRGCNERKEDDKQLDALHIESLPSIFLLHAQSIGLVFKGVA